MRGPPTEIVVRLECAIFAETGLRALGLVPAQVVELRAEHLAALAEIAASHGLLRLGAVALDDPRLAVSRRRIDAYLEGERQGEMAFMARTRELRRHPEGLLEGARSALVAVVPHGGEAGPVARYAQFVDYHTEIHRRLIELERALEELLPGVQTLVCVDTKPVPERALAMLAGLGFLGKHGCLIVPGLGSFLLIGCLLTTATWCPEEQRPPAPLDPPWDACGSCTACLDACPTGAFESPGILDPRRCISYLTIEHRGPIAAELMDGIGERVAGCDVCQDVCPYNAADRSDRVPAQAWLPAPVRPRDPDPLRLATIGNNQHRQFVKGTPLSRIPRRAVRRNAVVALGHRRGPLGSEEREALEVALDAEDEALREAAAWALSRRDPAG